MSKNPNYGVAVVPPGWSGQLCGLHWLERRNYDNQPGGMIALQWNPNSKTWTHSGMEGVDPAFGGRTIDTSGWRYVKPIEYPEIGE